MKDNRLQINDLYEKRLVLKEFDPLYSKGQKIDPRRHTQFMFTDTPIQQVFDQFSKEVISKIGNTYYPIYRMADGEFKFCIEHISFHQPLVTALKNILRNIYLLARQRTVYQRFIPGNKKERLLNIFDPRYFYLHHGEAYTRKEINKSKELFLKDLKEISEKGRLAVFLKKFDNQFTYPLTGKMLGWFSEHNIPLNENSYIPFYFIYALLSGSTRKHLLSEKNILIITNADKEKKQKIVDHLIKTEHASSVDFYDISYNKSMFDQIDFNKMKPSYDVVFLGAGVGSTNLISQLKSFNTVVIDAGIVIECWANPNLKESRIFLMSNQT